MNVVIPRVGTACRIRSSLGPAPGEHGISPYTQKLIMPEKRQNSGHLNTEAKGGFGSGTNKTRSESTDGRKD
jgi:hypothetical protein